MPDPYAEIGSAAHSGAFGLKKNKEPTLANLRAGNYEKGRVRIHGLPIAIETPQGTRRSGKEDGKPWSVICQAHYGYIERTRGADGDALDVFVGPWPESELVWIVNRRSGQGGFDEHKILLSFPDEASAITAYKNSYERGSENIQSVVPCTIDQLKWWIRYGNKKVPVSAAQFPYDRTAGMNDITWDSTATPVGISLPQLMYAMRREDEGQDLLLDSVCLVEVLEDSDGELLLDALVVPLNRLERKLAQLQVIMRAAGINVKPVAMQITPPFKQRGTTNVAGIIEMSDGQTVTIFFHNPDTTPNRLTPDDEMVSWKWLLNKKDTTIVVAREQGRDLNPREVGRRIMKLVEANSNRFKVANERRATRMANIEAGKASVAEKQTELQSLQDEIAGLEQRLEERKDTSPAASSEAEDEFLATIVEVAKAGDGQIAKLQNQQYFTVSIDGENPILTDELRAKVEAAIGVPLVEAVLPGLERQISLVPADAPTRVISPLDEFEAGGGETWQVTRDRWVEIMTGHMDFLKQSPDPGDYQDYHKSQVKAALDAGKVVPPEVLADYPGMVGETPEQIAARNAEAEAKLQAVISAAAGEPPPVEPAPSPDPLSSVREFLQSVIDGSTDLADPSLADRLTELHAANSGNPEFDEMFAKAADAYQSFMVELARQALK